MSISEVKRQFDELREQILADGKIDILEVYVLLDFVEDYANAGKQSFIDFKRILLECAKDKKITDEESELLITKMDEMSKFLRLEQIVEWVFVGIVAIVIGFGIMSII